MANIVGDNLNNILNGTIFSDIIAGQGGNDTLNGSSGNDILKGGTGTDTLNGGLGIDTADYSNGFIDPTGPVGPIFTVGATAGVNVNLNLQNVFQNTGGAGLDRLVSIENVTGTNFNDTLTGNAVNNVLSGLGGNDCLFGNGGNDTLLGGSGNDTLNGGLGTDVLNGGTGIDTAAYNNGPGYVGAVAGVNVNLNLAGFQNTGGAGLDQLVGIENLVGTNFNDTLIGNGANNELCGLAGNDRLFGNGGNDTLNGGLGNDLLNGGLGIDTADYSNKVVCGTTFPGATTGVRVNLNQQGVAQNTVGAGSDTLVSIENVTGSNFSDTLTGNTASNRLNGGLGNDLLTGGLGKDFLTGGLGNDTFDYNSTSESGPGVLSRDVITDFRGLGTLIGDRIDLSTIDANVFALGNQAFTWKGSAAFSSVFGLYTPGQLRYSGGVLQGNTDFDAAPEFEIQLTGAPALFVQAGHAGSDIIL